jgi:hypothetical protein
LAGWRTIRIFAGDWAEPDGYESSKNLAWLWALVVGWMSFAKWKDESN